MSEPAIPIGVPQRTNPVSVLARGASAVRNALFPMIAIFFGSGSRGYSVMLALGIGVLVMVIRTYGGLPEGVMYAILLMNAVSPLINRVTQARIYGESRKKDKG